jgi:1-acyl-sn-glycerol-3-phosphate acyltransferase
LDDPTDNVVPFPSSSTSRSRDLAPLREALRELRGEIDHRFPAGGASGLTGSASADAKRLDWIALFDELRERLGQLGVAERSNEVDSFGLDLMTLARAGALMDFLVDRYWRVEVRGAEGLPDAGPVVFVANHAGVIPWDGLVFAHCLARERPGWPRVRILLGDPRVTLPFAQPVLARLGVVRACRENAERLLSQGKSVLAFPEGERGATKVFGARYHVQRFERGCAVEAAVRRGVPLVPLGIVGAEEVHPLLFKASTVGRAIGVPFLPVTPSFPALGPLGAVPLPSKWQIEVGEPMDAGVFAAARERDGRGTPALEEALRDRVRALVARGLSARGSAWR